MKQYYGHIITPKTIFVVFQDENGEDEQTVSVLAENPRYERIKTMLVNGWFEEIPDAVDRALAVKNASGGKFTVQDGCIIIDGEALPDSLSDKLLELVDANLDTTPLERFWDNLKENPSNESRKDLYDFLTVNDFVITPDGCFIGYRRVRNDWLDKHSRTYDNSPGNTVFMSRTDVDPNRNNTCSRGLHIAAWNYAKNCFGNGRLIECKIHPKDVVTVPPDYNQQKMRVCRYQILREVENEYLGGPVWDEELDEDLDFEDIVDEFDTMEAEIVEELPEFEVDASLDSRWRLRIPGKAIRQLGVGVGGRVVAVIDEESCGFVWISQHGSTDCDASRSYVVDKDNSIQLSHSFMEIAGIEGYKGYTIELVGGNALEVRPS